LRAGNRRDQRFREGEAKLESALHSASLRDHQRNWKGLMSVNSTSDSVSACDRQGVVPSFARRWGPWVLLILAAAYFGWRGPYRALHRGTVDYPTVYAATRALIHGENPYDVSVINRVYHDHGGDPNREVMWMLNPPGTMTLMLPFGALPFPVSNIAITVVNVAIILLTVHLLARLSRWPKRDPRRMQLLAAALALAPFHTSVSQGQLTIATFFFAILAMWYEDRDSPWLAGIALGVGSCLKPQLMAFFGLFFLFRLRWRECLVAGVVMFALNLTAILRMEMVGCDWWAAWRSAFQETSAPGGQNDPARPGLERYLVLNLQMLFHCYFEDRQLVSRLVVISILINSVLFLWLARRVTPKDPILSYATVAVIGLLAVYHRLYSAVVLILIVAWALSHWRSKARRTAVALLLLTAPFVVSSAAAVLAISQRLPVEIVENPVWTRVVLPHPVILALAMNAVLLLTMLRYYRSATSSSDLADD
jgi:hypothetical protein